MNRTEQIIVGILGLLISACACFAAWYVPYILSSPTRVPLSPSNTPLVITFSPSETLPVPAVSTSEILPASTITTPPTPTIEPPTLLPTCQRQQVELFGKTLPWFNPPLISGNQGLDFNGNGPRVHVKVDVYVIDVNQVYAKVFMAAQEILPNTDLGPLRAEGDTSTALGGDFFVGEIFRPQDWQLTWEVSQNADIAYFDTDATSDIFPGDNSPLYQDLPHDFGPVAKFEIIGDTVHEDIGQRGGYHTGVQITLNTLRFLVEERFNCTN